MKVVIGKAFWAIEPSANPCFLQLGEGFHAIQKIGFDVILVKGKLPKTEVVGNFLHGESNGVVFKPSH